jgi:heme-degrading monooxygenase HmoA
MHVILWRFRARPGREAEFEQTYGESGPWVRFFGASEGYLGTELMRGTDGTYLTLDRWASKDAYRAFREAQAERYAELDARCEALTLEETLIGEVEA